MTSVLPAKRELDRTSLCGCIPVSSSLYHSVYWLCRTKQAHPEINNANNFTLRALTRDRF